MPNRDDHEAAHHRIHSLERELAETRERAERAERAAASARSIQAQPEGPKPTSSSTPSDPRWPAQWRQRYIRAMVVATVLLDLPLLVLLAGWWWDFDHRDRWLAPWTFAPFGAHRIRIARLGVPCTAPDPRSNERTDLSRRGWIHGPRGDE
jgi:hypothetical protein